MPLAPAPKFSAPPLPASHPKSLLQGLMRSSPKPAATGDAAPADKPSGLFPGLIAGFINRDGQSGSAANGRKSPEVRTDEAEALLQRLSRDGWERLRLQADDPLALLYNTQTSQWTMGWDPETGDCILLVWELHSWQEKPGWSLYRNGEPLLREAENASRARSALMHRLLESDQLPCVTAGQFLERLTSYRHPTAIRELAGRCLLATILARPEVFSSLRPALFAMLEDDLGSPDWPLLDVMKLHRVAFRTVPLRIFRELSRLNVISDVRDNARLVRGMALIEEDYVTLGVRISPLMRPAYDAALTEFHQTVMADRWRARLSLKPPMR